MMHYLLPILFLLMLLSGNISAQETNNTPSEPTEIYGGMEEIAPYPCECEGAENLSECRSDYILSSIYDNLEYPEDAKNAGQEGIVIISFYIQEDGTMNEIEVARSQGEIFDIEALRVVELLRKNTCWVPGSQRGIPVPVRYNVPVKFKLDAE